MNSDIVDISFTNIYDSNIVCNYMLIVYKISIIYYIMYNYMLLVYNIIYTTKLYSERIKLKFENDRK